MTSRIIAASRVIAAIRPAQVASTRFVLAQPHLGLSRMASSGSGASCKVGKVMTKNVALTNPEETVQRVAQLMDNEDAGAIPVGDNDRLVGMVTDRDIAIRCVAAGKDPARTKVREVMTQGTPLYCFEDEDCQHVAHMMGEQQVRRLPVMNREKRLVGIVSLANISSGVSEADAGSMLKQEVAGGKHGGKHNPSAEDAARYERGAQP